MTRGSTLSVALTKWPCQNRAIFSTMGVGLVAIRFIQWCTEATQAS